MQRAKEFGLSAKGIDYDLEAVVARSRGIAKQLNQGVGFLMKKNKITTLMGEARISSATSVDVTTKSKTETLKAKHIILATGARARELPGLEADGDLVWTYKHALTPSRMPKKLLVIGCGKLGQKLGLLAKKTPLDLLGFKRKKITSTKIVFNS